MDFFVHFAGTFWLSIYKNGDWFFVHPIPEGQKQISFWRLHLQSGPRLPWRSGAQFLLSSVNIKTLNIGIRIKTINFISVTIETKRRHDTCTCICVYWKQSGDVFVLKIKQYWHWKKYFFHPFSRKVSVGECRRVTVSFLKKLSVSCHVGQWSCRRVGFRWKSVVAELSCRPVVCRWVVIDS